MTRHPSLVVRTVGGSDIGFGHLRRCLTLATALDGIDVGVSFLVAAPPALVERVTAAGFEACAIDRHAGVAETLEHAHKRAACGAIVDCYGLPGAYYEALARETRVIAIDDLAEQPLAVDLVVNGSAGADRLAYRGATRTRYLLGPEYVLLRGEFAEWAGHATLERVRRVLVTTGGTDRRRLAPRLARWACEALGDVAVDVVIGPLFEDGDRDWPPSVTVHRDPHDIRGLMRAADVALCAGGQTLYELAATGTPAIAVRLAANQTMNLDALSGAGTILVAGDVADADLGAKVVVALAQLAADPARRTALSEQGRALVDGQGATRVARAIAELVERTP